MQIWRGIEEIQNISGIERGTSIAIGSFDGLHIGHRQILQAMTGHAALSGHIGLAITFEPHPLSILRPDASVNLLTTLEQKLSLMQQFGIPHCLILPFDPQLARLPASEFLHDFLIRKLNMRHIFVGYNFTFGHRGTGTAEFLRQRETDLGFSTHVFAAIQCNGEPISSTRIREAVATGKLEKAAIYLGRPYTVAGKVVHGRALGRTIGFPTANIQLQDKLVLPPNGVYAVAVQNSGQQYGGVANLGLRPTVDGRTQSLEVHLFEFEGDLYGNEIEVAFLHYIRPEQTFADLEGLRRQIEQDSATARSFVTHIGL